jgi:hypothetical protein
MASLAAYPWKLNPSEGRAFPCDGSRAGALRILRERYS